MWCGARQVDVNMHSGRMARVWVSSLGAFWPGMQALIGQEAAARDLHANFTAAWRRFGWLPEAFGFDLGGVSGADGGYNLRPEHVESAFLLKAATRDPAHTTLAARVAEALALTTRTRCGFARIDSVATGARGDVMESYFLAETLKYLWLALSDGAEELPDWALLSTEGHVLPVLPGPDDDGSEGRGDGAEGRDETTELEDKLLARAAAAATAAAASAGEEGKQDSAAAAAAAAAAAGRAEPAEQREAGKGGSMAATGQSASADSGGDDGGGKGDASCAAAAGRGDDERSADAASPRAAAACSSGKGGTNATTPLGGGDAAAAGAADAIPDNCRQLCRQPTTSELLASRQRLEAALPLLALRGYAPEARRLRRRRCRACVAVAKALAALRPPPPAEQIARLTFGGAFGSAGLTRGTTVLAQVLCSLAVDDPPPPQKQQPAAPAAGGNSSSNYNSSSSSNYNSSSNSNNSTSGGNGTASDAGTKGKAAAAAASARPRARCASVRPLQAADAVAGLDRTAVVLQLARSPPRAAGAGADDGDGDGAGDGEEGGGGGSAAAPPHALFATVESDELLEREGGPLVLRLDAAAAAFGPRWPRASARCQRHMAERPRPTRMWALPAQCPPRWPPSALGSVLSAAGGGGGGGSDDDAAAAKLPRCPTQRACEGVARLFAPWHMWPEPVAGAGFFERRLRELAALPAAALRGNVSVARMARNAADALACVGLNNPCAAGSNSGPGAASGLAPGAGAAAAAAAAGSSWFPDAALNAGGSGSSSGSRGGGHPCGRARALPLRRLARPDPPTGCSPPRNAAAVAGAVVLVDRGGCSFLDKAAAMADAGAAGVVVANVAGDGALLTMAADASGRRPSVPSLLVSRADGARLLWWLQRRPVFVTGVRGGLTPAPRKDGGAKQQQEQPGQQQQKPATQAPAGSSGSSSAEGKGGKGDAAAAAATSSLRVDLLLPAPTQAWLVERLRLGNDAAGAARAVGDVLRDAMHDRAALAALERLAGLGGGKTAGKAEGGSGKDGSKDAGGSGGGGKEGKDAGGERPAGAAKAAPTPAAGPGEGAQKP